MEFQTGIYMDVLWKFRLELVWISMEVLPGISVKFPRVIFMEFPNGIFINFCLRFCEIYDWNFYGNSM